MSYSTKSRPLSAFRTVAVLACAALSAGSLRAATLMQLVQDPSVNNSAAVSE